MRSDDIPIELWQELWNKYRSSSKIAKILNDAGYKITSRAIRNKIKKDNLRNENESPESEEPEKPIAAGNIKPFTHKREHLSGKRFVFTSAQNNTYVHKAFFDSLVVFCDYNDAKLMISPFTYNKNGFQNLADEDLWYDPKIVPYLSSKSARVAKGLVWCGELNILPTAVNPLSGFDDYTKSSSGIIPHTKINLKSIATPKTEPSKFLYTTGTITKRNYIQKKAGQKAEFHHSFGALYVEIDDSGEWYARQLNAEDNGNFYDLTNYYTPKDITGDHSAEGINYGDIHEEKKDGTVDSALWYGEDSMLETLRPKYQFIHDLSDFEARNHHNRDNPHFLAYQHFHGINNVEKGITVAARFLKSIQRDFCTTIVVESNHDLAYRRWLAEASVRRDPENARFFHESSAELYKQIEHNNKSFSIFEWAVCGKEDLSETVFLREDESFVIKDIECGMHGHLGPNGSRGSPRSFRGLGRKCNTGHTHTAGIIDGIYTAGVSASMDLGYNKGPSSWSFSSIITYANGKRTIVTVKNRKWRA